nr:hypothetical protein FFPRI1PSEUD_04720 [Pseudomonas sp. FFPRI_1]
MPAKACVRAMQGQRASSPASRLLHKTISDPARRSWLASEGVREGDAGPEGLFAGKPAAAEKVAAAG